MEALYRRICDEFGLGVPREAVPLTGGGPHVVKLRTARGSYVVKPVDEVWQVELYSTVEQALNARGVRQARLFRTRTGSPISASGHSVQELLPGSITLRPNLRQRHAYFEHLAEYDLALADIPAPMELLAADSVFHRVTEPQFLIEELPRMLAEHAPDLASGSVEQALVRLAGAVDDIEVLPRQVVHGDHGPDNVLHDGDAVVAIIDFSPHYQPALFGLAGALYWYHLYGTPDFSGIEASLAAYGAHRPLSDDELELWPVLLVREALRRLATPLAVWEELRSPFFPERVALRHRAVEAVAGFPR